MSSPDNSKHVTLVRGDGTTQIITANTEGSGPVSGVNDLEKDKSPTEKGTTPKKIVMPMAFQLTFLGGFLPIQIVKILGMRRCFQS